MYIYMCISIYIYIILVIGLYLSDIHIRTHKYIYIYNFYVQIRNIGCSVSNNLENTHASNILTEKLLFRDTNIYKYIHVCNDN